MTHLLYCLPTHPPSPLSDDPQPFCCWPPACESISLTHPSVLCITKHATEHTLFGGALRTPSIKVSPQQIRLSLVSLLIDPTLPHIQHLAAANRPTTPPLQTSKLRIYDSSGAGVRSAVHSNHWNFYLAKPASARHLPPPTPPLRHGSSATSGLRRRRRAIHLPELFTDAKK